MAAGILGGQRGMGDWGGQIGKRRVVSTGSRMGTGSGGEGSGAEEIRRSREGW